MSQLKDLSSRVGRVFHEGHTNVVYSVTFSPDGKSVASGSMDRTVRIWESGSSAIVGNPLRGHTHGIYSVSYSPNGKLLASGSRDYSVRVWDTSIGRQEGEPLRGHAGNVNSVAFSPGGNIIVSGSNDNSVRLWDVQNRSEVGVFTGHYGMVNSVAFSPDGVYITSGSDDTTIRVWDAERGTTILGPFQGNTSPVRSISYSPDGTQIVSGSSDNTVRLWDARSGTMTAKPYEGHTGSVCSVAFSPNSFLLASGAFDKTIRLWDIRAGGRWINPLEGHTGYVYSVAFSPTGNHIASGSNDGKVIVWDISDASFGTENPEASVISGGPPKTGARVSRHMSMKEMFDLLVKHGCVDLSSQMDPGQDSNFIVSGGGFGDIWTGKLQSGTRVAIKVWRSSVIEQCDGKHLRRAAQEVYYWSRMKHRNIHQLLGVIIFKENSLGMVSEWMENGNLREHMCKSDDFDRYEMCISIASGLAYMHQRDALNVLVSSDGVAKLADFGLSTMSEASLGFSETSNPQIGSTRWAAPELLTEETPKSKESDIYALGMTMLEVITGDVPFPQCHSDYQVIVKVTRGAQPTRPTDQLKDNGRSDQMWNLLVKCWDPTPSARPSAQQVLESLISIRALPE